MVLSQETIGGVSDDQQPSPHLIYTPVVGRADRRSVGLARVVILSALCGHTPLTVRAVFHTLTDSHGCIS